MNRGKYSVDVWSKFPDHDGIKRFERRHGWKNKIFKDEAAARDYAKKIQQDLTDLNLDFRVTVLVTTGEEPNIKVVEKFPVPYATA